MNKWNEEQILLKSWLLEVLRECYNWIYDISDWGEIAYSLKIKKDVTGVAFQGTLEQWLSNFFEWPQKESSLYDH